ncbi:RasGEF domain containing protein [Acanthamoeba castellanii str. Neff]|uniref:RasGEF domain containing protein n=1 Tax=Acanthamoeba castellanii (strain ATCC 30010 / Neff) TaxID=1257118 RepID=L8H319_ACACF|nr:RasGEF domain containing protein [Acanthamoeba castellanii str. Neff]ELR19622.1 RasGEF domain containing protein [Acanthamoeba castellanii str. Neff]
MYDVATSKEKARRLAFERLATEVMFCDDLERREALLLSYPLFWAEKRDMCALWLSLYDQTWSVDSTLPLSSRDRLLDFMQLWAGLYVKDFDDIMRGGVLDMLEMREQKPVVNRFKLLFFHSSIMTPTTATTTAAGPSQPATADEKRTRRRPFHSFSSWTSTRSSSSSDADDDAPSSSSSAASPSPSRLGSSSSVPAVAEREEWEGTGSGELEDKRMLKIRYRVRAMSLDLIGKKGSHASGLDGSQAAAPAGAAAAPTSLLDLKSEDIARELTMDEFELYCGVEPREFLGQAWQKERKAELAPNLTRLIERFNKIGYWVATEVLTKHDVKVRVKYIKKFIKIAFRCYECNNFNAIMQILSGLNNSSVKRLKDTWEALGERSKKKMEELESLMEPQSNFKNYRTVLHHRRHSANLSSSGPRSVIAANTPPVPRAGLHSPAHSPRGQVPSSPLATSSPRCGPLPEAGSGSGIMQAGNGASPSHHTTGMARRPTLPYVGLFLRYLTYLDENSPYLSTTESDGRDGAGEVKVNANLLRTRWEQVKEFLGFQAPPYRLPRSEAAAKYLRSIHAVADDEVLYHLSCSSQPSPRRDHSAATGGLRGSASVPSSPAVHRAPSIADEKVAAPGSPLIAQLTPWITTTDADPTGGLPDVRKRANSAGRSNAPPSPSVAPSGSGSRRRRMHYAKPLPALPPEDSPASAAADSQQQQLYDSGEPPLHRSNSGVPLTAARLSVSSPTLPRLRLDRIQRDDSFRQLLSSSESSSDESSSSSRSFGRLDDAHGADHHHHYDQMSTSYYDEGCWSQYSGGDWTDDDSTPLASPAVPLRPGFARQIV